MADSDKDILITPNTGATTDPKIVFSSGATSGDPITLSTVDDGTTSTLSFEGSAGQLFSISNDMSGTIFSVGDVSGVPSIEVDASGDVRIAEFGGNVTIAGSGSVGIGTSTPTDLLTVQSPASGGGNGITLKRNDNGTDQRVGAISFGNTEDDDLAVIAVKTSTGNNSDGNLEFYTQLDTDTTPTLRMHIGSNGQVNIGETPALVDGNNPRHVLHIGGTTVNPSYEQLSMAPGSNSGGETATTIRMANVGNDFYLTNNYYNWGTDRFDDTNEGQAFLQMKEDGRFWFGGRSSATTDSPNYNVGIDGKDGSISAGTYLTMGNGTGKLNVWGNSDTSDEDVELRLYDNDTDAGSAVPTIAFYKGSGGGPVRFADIRANDALGVQIRDGSGNDLLVVSLGGDLTVSGDVNSLSDARLKTDVKTLTNSLDKVKNLRGVSYIKNDKQGIGLIAQEVKEVLPEVVHEDKYYSVTYGNVVAVLIEAIKELEARVAQLEAK